MDENNNFQTLINIPQIFWNNLNMNNTLTKIVQHTKKARTVNKSYYFFVLWLLFTGQAQASSCFDAHILEPNFIALATDSNSSLANWYQKVFALETIKEFEFPDGSVTGKLMRRDEFVVEIFAKKKLFDRLDYQSLSSAEHWRGVMKFGFYTDAKLPKLKQCLISKGIKAGRIYKDENLQVDLLQVIDPENNVLEIIQRQIN
jgi:hypothetical protein